MSSVQKNPNIETYTQVIPVVFCSDDAQVDQIMELCGIARALTYNKLGSFGLGKLMTAKTQRITNTNRNRYRLRSYAANNPEKAANILKHNLGYKVKYRRLKKEKETIKNYIRKDLRRTISTPTQIFAEDLTSPIKGKQQAKHIMLYFN